LSGPLCNAQGSYIENVPNHTLRYAGAAPPTQKIHCSSVPLSLSLTLSLCLPLHEPMRKLFTRSQAKAPARRPHCARAEPAWGHILPTTLFGGASCLQHCAGRLAAPLPRVFIRTKKPYWVIRLHPLSCAHYLQYLGRLRLSSPVRDTVINSG
jgi:hypothetical protein